VDVLTWPIIVSLATSGLALLVSLAALGWQIVSWRRSGPRVHVCARAGVTAIGQNCVVLEVTNSGRLATEIETCGFDLPDGRHLVDLYDFMGQPMQLPTQLAAGGTVSFHYGAERMRIALIEEGTTGQDARAYVKTGHGRVQGHPFHLGKMTAALTGGAI
jgi:hypothetical protein